MTADDELDPRVRRTRQRVLATVIDLLRSSPTEEITHSRVAEASGVGRATLYRHWDAPTDLLFDAIEAYHADLGGSLTRTGDLRTDLRQLLGSLADRLRDDPLAAAMLSLVDRAQRDDAHAALLADVSRRRTSPIQELLADAVERGELRTDLDLDIATAQLVGPLFFQRFLARGPLDDAFVDALVDGWLDGA